MLSKRVLCSLSFFCFVIYSKAYDFDCVDFPTMLDNCFESAIEQSFNDNEDTFYLYHDEITKRCIFLRRYMLVCMDNYRKHCFVDERKMIDKRIFGTDTFVQEFCRAESWRTLRTRHEECFAKIQKESQKCGLEFISRFNAIKSMTQILGTYKIESQSNIEVMNLICCDRFVPSNCSYQVAEELCLEGTSDQLKSALEHDLDEQHYVRQMNELCHKVGFQLKCYNSAYSLNATYAIVLVLVSYAISNIV